MTQNKLSLSLSLSLSAICRHEPYVTLIDMCVISRMASPTAENRQTQDGTPYKWPDYVHYVSSIILARHGDADRVICVDTTRLKTTSETCGCRVRQMSPIPT